MEQPNTICRRTFIISTLMGVISAMTERGSQESMNASSSRKPLRFKQDRFCISFWVDPPADTEMDAHYAQIANANFTVVMGGFGANTPETDKRQLDLCQKYGIKALVYLKGYEDGAVQGASQMAEITQADQFPDHPACWGYMLHDEPDASLFPALRFMVDHLRSVRPGKLGFINLFPTYASTTQLGVQTYEEYVRSYINEVNPDVLCMDNYPFMQPSHDTRDDYCNNLSVLRKYALAQDIPFWNFFNTMPFDSHADPTEAQVRWQVQTSLAYGAKGVLYFCYWNNAGGAIIDPKGQPTRHYDQAKRINAKLIKWGPVLMRLRSQVVHRVSSHSNSAELPADLPFQISSGDFLIGVFNHADGRTAVLINNYSDSDAANPTVRFKDGRKKIVEIDHKTGDEVIVPNHGGMQLRIEAGDGCLFLIG